MTVATFTDANPSATAGDFTATIDWGDGQTTTGTVTEKNGVFSVAGSNTYADGRVGQNHRHDHGQRRQHDDRNQHGDGGDAALTANGSPVSATEGSSTGTVTVATFTDANPSATAGDFTATIDWGDGTTLERDDHGGSERQDLLGHGAAHTYAEKASTRSP